MAAGGERLTRLGSPILPESSLRLSQLDSCFIERGTLCLKRLRRSPAIVLRPWNRHADEKPEPKPARKERPDGDEASPPLPGFARLWQVRESCGTRSSSRRQPSEGDAGASTTDILRITRNKFWVIATVCIATHCIVSSVRHRMAASPAVAPTLYRPVLPPASVAGPFGHSSSVSEMLAT